MSFLSSIPVWGWFDIGFNIAVLVALGGETEVILRWLFPEGTSDLLPPESKRKKLKKGCEWLLIFGIAGEICCLPFSLYGTAFAEKKAALAYERAAIVESNNVALEAQIQPRRINAEKKQIIANALRQALPQGVNGRVKLVAEGYDSESRIFAGQIAEALNDGNIFVVFDLDSISTKREINFGVKYFIPSNPQYEVRAILQALKTGGVEPNEVETNFKEAGILFEIWIGAKPLR